MQLVLFQTPTEWVALALVLIAGWVWGLASAPGNRKWRNRLAEAEQDYASYRESAESELRALRQQAARDATPAPAPAPTDHARVAALEAENARLTRYLRAPAPEPAPAAVPPVVASPAPVPVPAPPVPEPVPAPPVHAAAPEPKKSGWLHAMEAGVAGAVVGAVADRLIDRADGQQDHGILHNLGAAAAGAAVGVLTERLADRHATQESPRPDA